MGWLLPGAIVLLALLKKRGAFCVVVSRHAISIHGLCCVFVTKKKPGNIKKRWMVLCADTRHVWCFAIRNVRSTYFTTPVRFCDHHHQPLSANASVSAVLFFLAAAAAACCSRKARLYLFSALTALRSS